MRLQYIDGLKGMGALMVFLTHYRMMGLFYPSQAVWDNPFLTFMMSGNIAVELFIMVSGFSISLSVERRIDSMSPITGLGNIIFKRYFRLALPVAFILIALGALYPLGVLNPHDVAIKLGGHPSAIKAYSELSYVRLIMGLFLSPIGNTYGWLMPLWMMRYIFCGTFVVIILKIGMRNLSLCGKVTLLLIFSLLFATISFHYVAIVIGCALSEIHSQERVLHKLKGVIGAVTSLCVALAIHVFFQTEVSSTIIALFILLGILFTDTLQYVFSKAFFKWVGKVSFAIYLLHWPLVCSFSVWEYNVLDTYPYAFVFCFLSTIVLLLFMSSVYQRLIEDKLSSLLITKVLKLLR